jgi:hypothetical protein
MKGLQTKSGNLPSPLLYSLTAGYENGADCGGIYEQRLGAR